MGLDMYLYATKEFDWSDPRADQILAAAKVSRSDLEAMKGEYQDDRSMYLGGWDFRKGSDEYAAYHEIVSLLGLQDLVTASSPSIYVGEKDGRLYLQITCAYWRKANSVHSWFVENCQDGVDECQESDVHVEQLAQLRSLCVQALDAYNDGDLEQAEEIMTPRQGFFFGAYDVDEWWAEDMKETISQIERVISQGIALGGVTFQYHSSW